VRGDVVVEFIPPPPPDWMLGYLQEGLVWPTVPLSMQAIRLRYGVEDVELGPIGREALGWRRAWILP
jgi:hypothetical protein